MLFANVPYSVTNGLLDFTSTTIHHQCQIKATNVTNDLKKVLIQNKNSLS